MSAAAEAEAAAVESLPDDVVAEILLCLPPHPSFVSGASLVCKRWLHLIRSPSFLRRVRAFHRTPPVLGFFHNYRDLPSFVPAEGVPGRNRMDGVDDGGTRGSSYWLSYGGLILEFQFGSQSLTLMKRPLEMLADVRLVRLEEDGLGLAFIKDSTLHLWAREVADDGASKWKWIPRRAIELDKFLPMPRVLTGKWCGEMFVSISGFSEDGNVVIRHGYLTSGL
ncbi:hypothetical protein OsI_32735 [Oryza sativa Indica Group]|uniref:F-box domain-containing protein n=1 Tax=Oryza sativa subsp. indica TaxID=39946 RepID=B8BFQ5_ORYSI|nr:hypothetical protein OsI_32735 [Oryza sativa Indica Group]